MVGWVTPMLSDAVIVAIVTSTGALLASVVTAVFAYLIHRTTQETKHQVSTNGHRSKDATLKDIATDAKDAAEESRRLAKKTQLLLDETNSKLDETNSKLDETRGGLQEHLLWSQRETNLIWAAVKNGRDL